MASHTVDISAPKPRVNFEQMQRYIGRKVLLVGMVEDQQPNQVQVKAADGGKVTVTLKDGGHVDTSFVEFEGLVDSPSSLVADSWAAFGNNFDLANYNELCLLANGDFQHKLFMK